MIFISEVESPGTQYVFPATYGIRSNINYAKDNSYMVMIQVPPVLFYTGHSSIPMLV